MRSISPSASGRRTLIDVVSAAIMPRSWELDSRIEPETYDKWPVWARLIIIVGLSGLLWAAIISGIMALFS